MQQINLYQFEDNDDEIKLPFALIVKIFCISFITLVLFSSILVYQYLSQRIYLMQAEDKKIVLTEQLIKLRNEIPTTAKKNKVTQKYEELSLQKGRKEKILYTLGKLNITKSKGFSEYLDIFSENFFQGIWITQFSISNNGNQISIQGETIDSSYIPEVLQNLGKSGEFSGQLFNTFNVQETDDSQIVKFSLGSS